jgi:glycosyltransferase involved in cell wall biosynthesis
MWHVCFPISNEGFSNSILEKMAMELPLVVTDVGGNKESVKDGYNGIVVSPGGPYSFSRCLFYICIIILM